MDWQNIVGVAGFIVAVGSLSGIGLMRDRLTVLKDLTSDLERKIDFLEKQRHADDVEKTAMQSEITRLKDHEEYTATLIRDRANYGAFSDQLDDIHRIVVGIDRKVT